MDDEKNAKGKGKGSVGEFFAVEYDAWPSVCGLGPNAAVAYVVLARFTGRDNTHTAASVQAIEKYTGMARGRAQESIDQLIRARLVERVPESPRTRPRYVMRSWRDAHADIVTAHLPAVEAVRRGEVHGKRAPSKEELAATRDAGLILPSGNGSWKANDPSTERNLVWMPNAFVTGTSAGEVPPLRRLRETGTVDALRLVVDLYAAHHLADDGGVSPRVVSQPWERHVITTTDHYGVLGFTRSKGMFNGKPGPISGSFNNQSRAWNGFNASGDAWKTMDTVQRLGLVEVVTTLFEGPEGEPMFSIKHEPLADAPDANAIRACGTHALFAAEAWGGNTFAQWRDNHPEEQHALMVPRHVENATLRGIYRLRYRPRTNATARWWGRLMNTTEAWTAKFRELSEHQQVDRRNTG